MNDIQSESIAAVMVPKEVMNGTAKLGIGQIRRAADIPRMIRKRITKFMASDKFAPSGTDYTHDSYEEILPIVSVKQDIDAEKLKSVLPSIELQTDIGNKANEIRQWAAAFIPRDTQQTFGEVRASTPNDLEVADFMSLWRVANYPLSVLDDLEDGMLMEDGVKTLSLLWPNIYAEIRQAISDANVSIKARRGMSWEPIAPKASIIRSMLGTDPIDMQLAASVQAVYAQNRQKQQQVPKQQRASSGSVQDGGEATKGQIAASS